jgi:hypothetical protein
MVSADTVHAERRKWRSAVPAAGGAGALAGAGGGGSPEGEAVVDRE